MRAWHINISGPAETDLREVAQHIANELKDPVAARQTIGRIAEAIFDLERMPLKYGLVQDERLALQGLRHLPVGNYIVFYKISEQDVTVTIIRILYGKRNWASLL